MTTRPGLPKTPNTASRGRQTAPKRKFPLIPVLIGAGVAILVGLYFVFFSGSSAPVAAVAPGGPVPTATTRDHVDGRVEYSTNPPTSGNHDANPATWGTYNSTPPRDERLVHNLEHGGVIISYDTDKVDTATIENLKRVVADLRRQRHCLILTPRDTIQDDKPIALTAWGALALLDNFDEAAIRAFWRDNVAKGPEFPLGTCN